MAGEPKSPLIYEIPYLRLFPWLRLFRAPGSACDPKRLILAVVGGALLAAGWAGLDLAFPTSGSVTPGFEGVGPGAEWTVGRLLERLSEPFRMTVAPFRALLDPSTDATGFLHACLAGVWSVVVWSLVGGGIARSAVVGLARGERVTWRDVLGFVRQKGHVLVVTPLLPFFGVFVVALGLAAFGLLYRLGGPGQVVAGALGFLPLIGGLLLAIFLVILAAAWPLMQAAVAAEEQDAFDAMSRSYAYVHQRVWLLAGYALLAAGIGVVALPLIDFFAATVVQLTTWGLRFGGGTQVLGLLQAPNPANPSTASTLHGFWLGLIPLLVRGWVFSYFWTSAATIYLLLRRDVDGTPLGSISHREGVGLLPHAAAGAGPEVFAPPVPIRTPGAPSGVPAPHAPIGDAAESA
ncbi:MAG: hypothetical protein U0835_11135 [Isosphaeraceae bacterium]